VRAPPQAVLAEALREALDGAELRAAVLTTFTLEWAFTIDEVLPVFVPHSLSAAPNVRREELADHLHTTGATVTLYYDARHGGDFERATRVPLAHVPVQHPTGYFHPKVVLALVDKDGEQRLVVTAGSANLTRSSWWEWVECAHVTTIGAGSPSPLRKELLGFVEYLHGLGRHAGDREAPERIRRFLTHTQQTVRPEPSGAERFIWNGAAGRTHLLDEIDRLVGDHDGGTVEVISPWFGDTGDAVLRRLVERTGATRTLALVPTDPDGNALLPAEAVERLDNHVQWANLPQVVTSSGPTTEAKPRHVHAKVYRFTRPLRPAQTLVVGSFNLTDAAFDARGNLEAGFVVERRSGGKDPWLTPREVPTQFAPLSDEADAENHPLSRLSPLRLTYDWRQGVAETGWDEPDPPPAMQLTQGPVVVLDLAQGQVPGRLGEAQATALRGHLTSSSPVLTVVGPDGDELGYTLVTELGVSAKPSADVNRRLSDSVADLLLDAEARRTRRAAGGEDEDIEPTVEPGEQPDHTDAADSIFDSYAALYQGLAAFERQLRELPADSHPEIEYRLTAEGPRCLGDLLTSAEKTAAEEPTMALVVCWGVEDLIRALAQPLAPYRDSLDAILARTKALRAELEERLVAENSEDAEFERFLQWGRNTFGRM
jgi:hypothetical protein